MLLRRRLWRRSSMRRPGAADQLQTARGRQDRGEGAGAPSYAAQGVGRGRCTMLRVPPSCRKSY